MRLFTVFLSVLVLFGISFSVNVSGCSVIDVSGTYTLNQNLDGANVSALPEAGLACIKIAASSVTFDCMGYTITNNGTPNAFAIMLNNSASGVIVRNCPMITGYDYAVYVLNTAGGGDTEVSNVTAYNNSAGGFYFENTSDNDLFDNLGHGNGLDFFFSLTGYNYLEDNLAYDVSGPAFFFEDTLGNDLYNCSVFNGSTSLFFTNTSDNSIYDSYAENNTGPAFYFSLTGHNFLSNVSAYNNSGSVYLFSNTLSNDIDVGSSAILSNGMAYFFVNTGDNSIYNSYAEDTFGSAYFFSDTGHNFLSNTSAYNTIGPAFFFEDTLNNDLDVSSSAEYSSTAFLFSNTSDNTIYNSYSRHNSGPAYNFELTGHNYLSNVSVYNNTASAFFFEDTLSNDLDVSSSSELCNMAYYFYNTTDNTIYNSYVKDATGPAYNFDLTDYNFLSNTSAYNISGPTFYFTNTLGNDLVVSTNAELVSGPVYLFSNTTDNNIYNSFVRHASGPAYNFDLTDYNFLSNTSAYNISNPAYFFENTLGNDLTVSSSAVMVDGLAYYFSNTTDNNLYNPYAWHGTASAYFFDDTDYNYISNATAFNITSFVFYFTSTLDNTVLDSLASNNSAGAFFFEDTGENTLTRNTIHDHSEFGTFIYDNTGPTTITSHHYYNNNPDFIVDGNGIEIELVDTVFDGPAGSYADFTNISLNDVVASAYSVNWSTMPRPLPPGSTSFSNKYINITYLSGDVSIDSIVWHWLDSELGTLNEFGLAILYHSGTDWIPANDTPDTIANELALSGVTDFGEYALVEYGTIPAEGGGGDGGRDELTVSLSSTCDGNVVTVEHSGSPVSGASVAVSNAVTFASVASGTTNSSGEYRFNASCGITVDVLASKSGYSSDSITDTLVACSVCEPLGCVIDADCPDSEVCVEGTCSAVPCACGIVTGHVCVAYECCSSSDCEAGLVCSDHECVEEHECTLDSDCLGSEYCLVPAGEAGGSCIPVTGCGTIENHTLVPYECGIEAGCPSCAPGLVCVDNKCIGYTFEGPDSGLVGERLVITAKEGGEACSSCTVEVTDPRGEKTQITTDPDGRFELELTSEGMYELGLMEGGPETIFLVNALLQQPTEEQPPAGEPPTDFTPLLLLLLLLALGGLIIYLRRKRRS